MKKTKIGLVHATMNSVQPILSSFYNNYPEIDLLNVMDESLIKELNEMNQITTNMLRRLIDLASKADDANVDGILFTCSSFSPYIPEMRHLFSVPTLSADESMLKKAVSIGESIGVIATVKKAGPTTERLLYETAGDKPIQVKTVIVPEAFEKLQQGDTEGHDQIIHERISELSNHHDVIILAQFSMARAIQTMSKMETPILTSPESSCHAIVELVSKHSLS